MAIKTNEEIIASATKSYIDLMLALGAEIGFSTMMQLIQETGLTLEIVCKDYGKNNNSKIDEEVKADG